MKSIKMADEGKWTRVHFIIHIQSLLEHSILINVCSFNIVIFNIHFIKAGGMVSSVTCVINERNE